MLDPGWTVRRATVGDAETIAHLNARSWRQAYRGLVPEGALTGLDVRDLARRWRTILAEAGQGATFLAVRDDPAGERVGAFCAVTRVREPRPEDGPATVVGELYALYADPTALGSGAGRAVHDAGVSHRWTVGDKRLVLWVLTGNQRARRFYTRRGWRCDELVEHHTHRGEPLEVVRYSLRR